MERKTGLRQVMPPCCHPAATRQSSTGLVLRPRCLAQTNVYATVLPTRHLEDIHVAKLYCTSSFKRNRFAQCQFAGTARVSASQRGMRGQLTTAATRPLSGFSVPLLP